METFTPSICIGFIIITDKVLPILIPTKSKVFEKLKKFYVQVHNKFIKYNSYIKTLIV